MSELQFPKYPIVGQEYDFPPYRYYWDGVKWKTKGIGYNPVNELRDELEPRISDSESKISNNELQISNSESKVFEALKRSYADAGLNLVEGSFEEGGELLVASDVMITASGDGYSWGGPEFPHNVAAGTDPTALGSGYILRTDVLLRAEVGMRRFTSAQAPSQSYYEGELVYLTDVGYVFKFKASRYLIDGQSQSEMTFSDSLHILVTAGGMLQFAEFDKLRGVQSANSARFAAAIKDRTTPVTVDCYGDSITFGQALADTPGATNMIGVPTGFGDGSTHDHWMYNNHYPQWIASEIANGFWQGGAVNNFGYSGDRTISAYLRHRATTGALAATVMYGVNETLFASSNGASPAGITTNSLYSVKSYADILRLFVAKQIIQGKYVTILGTTPFASLTGFDGTQLAAQKLTRAYNAAAKRVAEEFGCKFVDVAQDIAQQYGVMEFTQEGTHPSNVGLKIVGTRVAAALFSVESDNRVQSGTTLIANPAMNALWSRDAVNVLPNAISSTPRGVTNDEKTTIVVSESGVTIPFYAESDSLVLYVQGVFPAGGSTFRIELDRGSLQSDFWVQRANYSGKPTSTKEITYNTRLTYESVDIFDDTSPFLVVANRGWHTLTVTKVSGGSVLLDSLHFVDLDTVLANQVSALAVINGVTLDNAASRNISSVEVSFPNEPAFLFKVPMLNANYTVVCDTNETTAQPVAVSTRFKTVNSFGVAFWKMNLSGVWELFAPTSATIRVIGGR